jgi:hypothetical protein
MILKSATKHKQCWNNCEQFSEGEGARGTVLVGTSSNEEAAMGTSRTVPLAPLFYYFNIEIDVLPNFFWFCQQLVAVFDGFLWDTAK